MHLQRACLRLMTSRTTLWLCSLAVLSACLVPASSVAEAPKNAKQQSPQRRQETVLESISAKELAEYLREEGYSAKLRENDEDKNVVDMKVNGRRVVAFVFDEGQTIELFMGFSDQTISLSAINEWNHSNRVSRISINDDGDAQLSLRLHLNGGVTSQWIVIHTAAFREDCEAFEKVIRDK